MEENKVFMPPPPKELQKMPPPPVKTEETKVSLESIEVAEPAKFEEFSFPSQPPIQPVSQEQPNLESEFEDVVENVGFEEITSLPQVDVKEKKIKQTRFNQKSGLIVSVIGLVCSIAVVAVCLYFLFK